MRAHVGSNIDNETFRASGVGTTRSGTHSVSSIGADCSSDFGSKVCCNMGIPYSTPLQQFSKRRNPQAPPQRHTDTPQASELHGRNTCSSSLIGIFEQGSKSETEATIPCHDLRAMPTPLMMLNRNYVSNLPKGVN